MERNGIETDYDGLEAELEREEQEPIEKESITQPFDPKLIRVETKTQTVDLIVKRIEYGEIDLMPDFQRKGGIWTRLAKSRLIESLLIRIPIPAFYFDGTNEDKLLVVDGLQRLNTIYDFRKGKWALTDLEFLKEYNGFKFDKLPRHMQRRIEETQFIVYMIDKGTPSRVKLDIFKRINTGGLPLSSQEIRHALNPGIARKYLQELAENKAFLRATNYAVSSKRMMDRACVLRFLAFSFRSISEYVRNDFDFFLNETMEKLNKTDQSKLEDIKVKFISAMENAFSIFGEGAFRKSEKSPINKPLFETWSLYLGNLNGDQVKMLVDRKNVLKIKFIEKMEKDNFFLQSITQGTGTPTKVKKRFTVIEQLIQETLND